jgi:hypothetical protein
MTEQAVVENNAPNVPEKFLDSETGAVNVEALLKSYQELERRMSSSMPLPQSDDDKRKVMRLLGCPETPDGYDVRIGHNLFTADAQVNQRLHEQGLTVQQVQAVYDLAAEKFAPMILELAQEFQADREVERLAAAFGGPEQFGVVSRQLLAYGKKNLSPDVLNNLASSFEGVMALYRMMKGQEPGMSAAANGGDPAAGGEDDLRQMMRDPRYWRDKDPAYVAKVTEGFKKIYG